MTSLSLNPTGYKTNQGVVDSLVLYDLRLFALVWYAHENGNAGPRGIKFDT